MFKAHLSTEQEVTMQGNRGNAVVTRIFVVSTEMLLYKMTRVSILPVSLKC